MDCMYHPGTIYPKRSALIVSHFIKITTILHQMRNVHSEVAILSSAPIESLKGTWSRVPKSSQRTFSHFVGAAVLSLRDGHELPNVQDGKGV
ncbi:hypothetical protein TNCV_757431 [Trichonephila clavipes]|nr:hypothetical protein TNCV_757431 [Trichonephila clavipes]